MPEQTQKKRAVSRGRDVKAKKTSIVEIEPGTFYRVRRGLDFSILLIRGLIPTPLLGAVQRLFNMREEMNTKGPLVAMEKLTPEDRDQFLDLMRKCALAVTVEPRLTDSKLAAQSDPDLLWVGGFSDIPGELDGPGPHHPEQGDLTDQALIALYRVCVGEIKVLDDTDADDFRTGEQSKDADVRDDGGIVQSEAVVVAAPSVQASEKVEIEMVHG